MIGSKLQKVTGWALLIGAFGVFWDAAEVHWLGTSSLPDGSLGLIPAYLGIVVGLTGLALVNWRVGGPVAGVLVGVGAVATFVFWGSYPSLATLGGLGALAIGVSMLFMPGWGRFVSPVWVVAGTMGVPELAVPGRNWGPISGFTLIGASLALTGAFVLWGLIRQGASASPLRTAVSSS